MLISLDSKQRLSGFSGSPGYCKASAGLAGTEHRRVACESAGLAGTEHRRVACESAGLAGTEHRRVACESAGLAGTEYRKVACESAGLAGVSLETVDDLRPGPGGSRAPSSVAVKKGATWNNGATWIQTSMFQCERGTSSANSCIPPIIEAQLIGKNITGIPPNMLQLNREHWLDSRDRT